MITFGLFENAEVRNKDDVGVYAAWICNAAPSFSKWRRIRG